MRGDKLELVIGKFRINAGQRMKLPFHLHLKCLPNKKDWRFEEMNTISGIIFPI